MLSKKHYQIQIKTSIINQIKSCLINLQYIPYIIYLLKIADINIFDYILNIAHDCHISFFISYVFYKYVFVLLAHVSFIP